MFRRQAHVGWDPIKKSAWEKSKEHRPENRYDDDDEYSTRLQNVSWRLGGGVVKIE